MTKTWRMVGVGVVLLLLATGIAQAVKLQTAAARIEVFEEQARRAGEHAEALNVTVTQLLANAQQSDTRIQVLESSRAHEREEAAARQRAADRRIASLNDRIGTMTSELTPEILVVVQPLLTVYEERVAEADSARAAAEAERDKEKERADAALLWGEQWRSTALTSIAESTELRGQVAALESAVAAAKDGMRNTWWILPEAEWWHVAVAAGVGYVAATRAEQR